MKGTGTLLLQVAVSAVLLAWNLSTQSISHARRFLGVVLDLATISWCTWFLGERGWALYLVYVWVTLANGFRFGPAYLHLSLAVSLIAAPAVAQSVSSRPQQSATQIATTLTGQGYQVLEIERDDGRYEVKAITSAGRCVEMDVSTRGDVIRTKSDDDCQLASRTTRGAR